MYFSVDKGRGQSIKLAMEDAFKDVISNLPLYLLLASSLSAKSNYLVNMIAYLLKVLTLPHWMSNWSRPYQTKHHECLLRRACGTWV